MSERDRLLQAIATIIEDYQSGILPTPTPEHVERWIEQFPQTVQQPILAELEYVLAKTYFSKARVHSFMKSVIHFAGWTKGNDTEFWHQMNFLDLQPRGNSQRDLIEIFDANLYTELGFNISNCGMGNKYIYIDDGLFSGGRIESDINNWITNVAPNNCELYVAVIVSHKQGHYFKSKSIDQANIESRKNIKIRFGHLISIQDGIFDTNSSDVLRPTGPGDDPAVAAYITTLEREITWRTSTSVGPLKFFSSNQGRHLLEQEFLKKGVAVRAMCPNFNAYQRPLGNSTMRTLGFGTMFATYRNCPNNAPLVLWAGDPWYPLLRRITN